MAQGTISQRISLEGAQEIQQQLSQMGAAGERALRLLHAAAASSGSGLESLSGHAQHLGNDFRAASREMEPLLRATGNLNALFTVGGGIVDEFAGKLGGLATGIVAAAAGLLLMGKNAAESTRALENQAGTLGLSIEKFEGLRFAFSRVGVSEESFTRGLDRFAVKLGEAAELQKKHNDAYLETAEKAEKSRIEVEKLQLGVTQAAQAMEKSQLATLEAKDALAQAQSSALKTKDAYDNLRGSLHPTATALGLTTQEHHKLTESQTAATVAANKITIEQAKLGQTYNESQNAATRFRIAQDELRLKQNEVVKATDDSKNAFLRLGVAVLDAQGNTREVGPAFLEFADKFKEIKEPAEQARIAMQVFGRAFRELLPGLRLGGAELERLSKVFEEFGVSATEEELKFATEFNAAFSQFTAVAEGLKMAVGNIVGTVFTPLFNYISEGLIRNAQNIRDFATAVSHLLGDGLQTVLQGVALAFKALELIVDGFRRILNSVFGTGFNNGAVAAMLLLARFAPLVGTIVLAVDLLRRAVNAIFGTEFTTGQAAAIVLLVRFLPTIVSLATGFLGFGSAVRLVTTAFTNLQSALRILYLVSFVSLSSTVAGVTTVFGGLTAGVRAVGAAFGILNLAAAPWIALGIVIAAVIAALVLVFTNTQKISDFIRKYIGNDAADTFDKFAKFVKEAWADLTDTILRSVASWADWFAKKIGSMLDWVNKLIVKVLTLNGLLGGGGGASVGSEGSAAMQPDPGDLSQAESHAGGGSIRGPGGRDRVPAWLTAGEFVHRVQAVQHYGLDFMHRINTLQVPRFNLGGLVNSFMPTSMAPRFAAGGLAGGHTSAVTLVLEGRSFGMSAAHDVAEGLLTHAKTSSIVRAARPPSWKGTG